MTTIIRRPLITEKSLNDTKLNKYTFEVNPQATKTQIKAAIQAMFKVNVVSVTTATYSPVARRTGKRRLPGMTTTTKKAIIQLKAGQTIKLFETTGQ
jgi:large subunit ribosomal protein L23